MMIHIDNDQAEVLRETLASALAQLRLESARADSSAFRRQLHHREELVESVLAKLSSADPAWIA